MANLIPSLALVLIAAGTARADPLDGPPGCAPAVVVVPATPQASTSWSLGWVSALPGFDQGPQGGLRLTGDLASRRGWSFGASFGVQRTEGDLDYLQAKALGTVSRTLHAGIAHVRLEGGFGAMYMVASSATAAGPLGAGLFAQPYAVNYQSLLPVFELSATAGVDLGRTWGIEAGPVVTFYATHDDHGEGLGGNDLPGDATLFLGVRHRM